MKTSSRTLFYFTILGNTIYSNVLRSFHEIYHVCLHWGTLWFKYKIQNVLFTSLLCQESHPLMTLALPPLRDTPELSLSYICHSHFPCHYRSVIQTHMTEFLYETVRRELATQLVLSQFFFDSGKLPAHCLSCAHLLCARGATSYYQPLPSILSKNQRHYHSPLIHKIVLSKHSVLSEEAFIQ